MKVLFSSFREHVHGEGFVVMIIWLVSLTGLSFTLVGVQRMFPFRLHWRKTDNQGRTLLPLFRLYTMDNVLDVYWGFSILFLIILTYAASCCVTFGRKMPSSSWMGIEDGTFHQILCNSDILKLAKFKSLNSSSVDLSNYKKVVSGGVASNKYVRTRLNQVAENNGLQLVSPPPSLCTDNGNKLIEES